MSKVQEHICIISLGYPTENNPFFTFVDQLVCALADLGVRCSVISPQSFTKRLIRKTPKNPSKRIKKTPNNNDIYIYQPEFISISNFKLFGFEIGETISEYLFERAVKKTFRNLKEKPTIMYGHFWSCGLIAARIAQREILPSYVATGECNINILRSYRLLENKPLLDSINGVISVSTENKDESIKLGLAEAEKIVVLPNGIDPSKFYKIDKYEARAELGYSKDDFIVVYNGWFSERKGSRRLSEALNKLSSIKSIFIGNEENTLSPEYRPDCDGILFCGRLAHKDIVRYLNCADVFVLPTLAEGCCNAIVEAMACGLPIISSNLPFNDDILDYHNSIRINPNSVDEIANAICYLRDNPGERMKMSEASLRTAYDLSIEKRAKKILEFILHTK